MKALRGAARLCGCALPRRSAPPHSSIRSCSGPRPCGSLHSPRPCGGPRPYGGPLPRARLRGSHSVPCSLRHLSTENNTVLHYRQAQHDTTQAMLGNEVEN